MVDIVMVIARKEMPNRCDPVLHVVGDHRYSTATTSTSLQFVYISTVAEKKKDK